MTQSSLPWRSARKIIVRQAARTAAMRYNVGVYPVAKGDAVALATTISRVLKRLNYGAGGYHAAIEERTAGTIHGAFAIEERTEKR